VQTAELVVESAPAVDINHLRRFTRDDEPLIREVLQLFADQAPHYVKELMTPASDRAWFEAAHALKGCARAIGAWPLARHAEMAERLRDGSQPGCQARRAAVLGEIARAIAETVGFIARIAPRS
jgi:HPt (histidine-containing phosphotransfer) domain-containing protein